MNEVAASSLGELVELMLKLSEDSNFKISVTALQIIAKLAKHDAFHNQIILDSAIPDIVSKLTEPKVAVRSIAMKVIRDSLKVSGR